MIGFGSLLADRLIPPAEILSIFQILGLQPPGFDQVPTVTRQELPKYVKRTSKRTSKPKPKRRRRRFRKSRFDPHSIPTEKPPKPSGNYRSSTIKRAQEGRASGDFRAKLSEITSPVKEQKTHDFDQQLNAFLTSVKGRR